VILGHGFGQLVLFLYKQLLYAFFNR